MLAGLGLSLAFELNCAHLAVALVVAGAAGYAGIDGWRKSSHARGDADHPLTAAGAPGEASTSNRPNGERDVVQVERRPPTRSWKSNIVPASAVLITLGVAGEPERGVHPQSGRRGDHRPSV